MIKIVISNKNNKKNKNDTNSKYCEKNVLQQRR